MIRAITVTNYLGNSIRLELANPEKSGFAVQSIAGLGSGKANINISEVATNDGGTFNSARVENRNIIISLKYLWIDSIEDTRQRSYKYFPVKKKCKLLFETDNRTAEIYGYVESNEPNIFSSNEGSEISIICPYPFFYSAGEDGIQTTIFSGIDPYFQFPFSNESLNDKLIKMGEIVFNNRKKMIYLGDAEIGVTITIHAIGPVKAFDIYNETTRQTMSINTAKLKKYFGESSKGLIAGDDVIICTVKGEKSITLLREGKFYNLLNCLEKNTDWIYLVKGENILSFNAYGDGLNLQFKIENHIVYEGI